MTQFTLTTNNDGRLEAIYIGDDLKVKHIWQLFPDQPEVWSNENDLYGPNGEHIANATTLGAYTDQNGNIQVVAQNDIGFHRIGQRPENGPWSDWQTITQQ